MHGAHRPTTHGRIPEDVLLRYIGECVPKLIGPDGGLSLQGLREHLQRYTGVDLSNRKTEIRHLANLAVEALTGRWEPVRGRQMVELVLQSPAAFAIPCECWKGVWEPLVCSVVASNATGTHSNSRKAIRLLFTELHDLILADADSIQQDSACHLSARTLRSTKTLTATSCMSALT